WVEGQSGFGAAIEVKAAGIGGEVARRAWASPSREHFAIYSFLPNEVVAAKAAEPDLPCVLLLRLDDDPGLVVDRISACHADGADVPWQRNAGELMEAIVHHNS